MKINTQDITLKAQEDNAYPICQKICAVMVATSNPIAESEVQNGQPTTWIADREER